MDELFEHSSIKRAYFTLALPVVLSMAVTLIYNMVDTFFVAKTGNPNLVAGVSQGAPVFTLMIARSVIFLVLAAVQLFHDYLVSVAIN